MYWAVRLVVDQYVLAGRVVPLAVHAVPAGVLGLVDQPLLVEPLESLRHDLLVVAVRRPYEVVVAYVEHNPVLPVDTGHLVHELLRGNTLLLGRSLYFEAVLVVARQEEDFPTHQPVIPGKDVRVNGRVGVPYVRGGVRVVYRRGDVQSLHLLHRCLVIDVCDRYRRN